MFGRKIRLFKIFGFTVHIDMSWTIIALLLTWSLSAGLFPFYYEDLSVATYWLMGAAGALGLFVSVVLHELSHSLVARRMGLEMSGITLFVFGGVAEMDEEPKTPKVEALMALAGPASSVVIGGVFWLIAQASEMLDAPVSVVGVLTYVAVINLVLAAFNMVPAFPLDGGRVFRSILWQWKDNLQWATKIAGQVGAGFGFVLMFLGALNIVAGNIGGGIWWILIGMFLRGASRMSRQQLMMKTALKGEPVRRFMRAEPVTVSPDTRLDDWVENYVYRHHYKFYPVVNGNGAEGYVSTEQLKNVSKENWPHKTISEIEKPLDETVTISPDEDATAALAKMTRGKISRLLVMEGGKLAGIIALKDLLEYLSLKAELESGSGRA